MFEIIREADGPKLLLLVLLAYVVLNGLAAIVRGFMDDD